MSSTRAAVRNRTLDHFVNHVRLVLKRLVPTSENCVFLRAALPMALYAIITAHANWIMEDILASALIITVIKTNANRVRCCF